MFTSLQQYSLSAIVFVSSTVYLLYTYILYRNLSSYYKLLFKGRNVG